METVAIKTEPVSISQAIQLLDREAVTTVIVVQTHLTPQPLGARVAEVSKAALKRQASLTSAIVAALPRTPAAQLLV